MPLPPPKSHSRHGTGGVRAFRIACRTAHIVGSCFLVGGHAYGASRDALIPWLIATVASGALLIASDLRESLQWFRELRGVAVLAKASLLLLVLAWWQHRVAILVAVIVVGSVVSHMPGRYRYWVLFGPDRRAAGADTAGGGARRT
ncbi:MAG: hypothetical protein D6689_20015 [Deltaproteobacteria bacterium]|nr:MAG: hypothetical protein D6689_20015 [Deltaproteobacteria bacterium]